MKEKKKVKYKKANCVIGDKDKNESFSYLFKKFPKVYIYSIKTLKLKLENKNK